MRICCLGDVHYHGGDFDYLVKDFTRGFAEVCRGVDAIVVVGDITSSGRLDYADDVLRAIKMALRDVGLLNTPILVVPGNHDIYLTREEMERGLDSLQKLSKFNSLVESANCVALMEKPLKIGGSGFVGTIGWYDYSFAPQWLKLPIDAYRKKVFGTTVWADKEFVKLPFSDEEFVKMLLDKFEKQIREMYNSVDRIVVVMHHLPFRELVYYKHIPEWDYFSTFMGSEAFGKVIKEYNNKIKLVLYGHSHNGIDTRTCKEVDNIKCCNCASPKPTAIEV